MTQFKFPDLTDIWSIDRRELMKALVAAPLGHKTVFNNSSTPSPFQAQTSPLIPSLAWSRLYGGAQTDFATDAVQAVDGDYIFVGWSHADGSTNETTRYSNVWAVKVDGQGAVREGWPKSLGLDDAGRADAIISSDDGYLILGSAVHYGKSGRYKSYPWLHLVNGEGLPVWQHQYSENGIWRSSNALAEVEGGGYTFVGTTEVDSENPDIVVIKVDNNGETVWIKSSGRNLPPEGKWADTGSGHDIVATADGGVLIAGSARSLSAEKREVAWLIKLDANGNVQWENRYPKARTPGTAATALTISKDGGYAFAGKANSEEIPQGTIWVRKVTESGSIDWKQNITASDIYPTEILSTHDGGYLVVVPDKNATWLLSLDSEGNVLTEDGLGSEIGGWGRSLIHTRDGGYLLAGNAIPDDELSQAWLAKLGESQETGAPKEGFRPTVHGFGFVNSIAAFPGHKHGRFTFNKAMRVVTNDWKPRLIEAFGRPIGQIFLEQLAKIIYWEMNEGSPVDGHCAGMSYAARKYFKNPDEIPVDKQTASEIDDPTTNGGKVADDIDFYQTTQVSDFENFILLASLQTNRIGLDRSISELRGKIAPDEPVPLFMSGDSYHVTLAYGLTSGEEPGVSIIELYDPNYSAFHYRSGRKTFEFREENGSVTVVDGLHSRFGGNPGLEDMFVPATLRPNVDAFSPLLGAIVTFLMESPATLSVTDPEGKPVTRLNQGFRTDRLEGDFVYRLDAPSGVYDVSVEGTGEGDYRLEMQSSANGNVVDTREVNNTITEGDIHEYILKRAEDGSIEVVEGSTDEGQPQTVMITGNVPVDYALTVDGTLRPDTKGGEFFGEEDDAPTQGSDGTWTATDGTGPHPTNMDGITYYGDRFFFSGSITGLEVNPDKSSYDVNIYIDEQEVTVEEAIDFAESTETHTFMLTANGPTKYTLSVDGSLEPDTKGGDFSAGEDDTPTQNEDGTWTASDGTGPHPSNVDGKTYYGDRFFFTGTIVEIELSQPQESGDVNLYLNEERVEKEELIG